jgi:hypothetical protein
VRYIHYGIAEDGHVWIRYGDAGAIAPGELLCSPFTIDARFDGGIRLIIEDAAGTATPANIWRHMLKSRAETIGRLVSHGMRLGPGGADLIMDVLRSANPQKVVDLDAPAKPATAAPSKPTSAIRESAC